MRSNAVRRVGAGAASVVAAVLTWAAPAWAQDPQTLHDALFGAFRRDDRGVGLPALAKYKGEAGQRFVLDRTGRAALMRFDDSPEIWVLKPTPGPRGDVIYRNDVGDPMLRSMRVGGLTLFTPDQPMGTAAAIAGPAQALRPAAISTPGQLLQTLIQASTRVSRAAQKLIAFEAPDYTLGTEPVWADAAVLTAEAFVRVGAGPGGRQIIARFVRVRFYPGKPAAALAGREVRIFVSPKDGVAGRPSSRRIATVIASR